MDETKQNEPIIFTLEELRYITRKVYGGRSKDTCVNLFEMRKLLDEQNGVIAKYVKKRGRKPGTRSGSAKGYSQSGSQGA